MMKKIKFIPLGLILMAIFLKRVQSDKLVIDTDGGADDAMALLLTLSVSAKNDSNFDIVAVSEVPSKSLIGNIRGCRGGPGAFIECSRISSIIPELYSTVAITCSYGNTNLSNVEKNVLKTLTVANESKIPVYSGAFKPLTENHTSDNFFGNDGFGDFKFNREIIGNIDRSKHAAVAMVDLANKYPGELSILVLGPTTNVALAISLDPKFVYKVKRFYVIGGSVLGIGNRSPGVEFNFGADPESNFILFNSTRRENSLLLPWETILSTNILSSWRKNVLGRVDSKFIKFLNKAESKIKESPNWEPSDPLIAAAMLCSKLIKQSTVLNLTPVIDGEARGGTLVDYIKRTHKPNNVEIIQKIDVEGFQKILLSYLS